MNRNGKFALIHVTIWVRLVGRALARLVGLKPDLRLVQLRFLGLFGTMVSDVKKGTDLFISVEK
jgi:hypothetical protein